MTALRRAIALAAFVAASAPTPGLGQTISVTELVHRIDSLQLRTSELERRVTYLEGLIKGQVTAGQPVQVSTGDPGEIANWRKLRRGMKPDAVRALLGEPEKVVSTGPFTTWHYPDISSVSFNEDKVDGWMEPRR